MGSPAAAQVLTSVHAPVGRRLPILAALTYAGLVLVMWLPFNPCGGMPYESHFMLNSEFWPISGFLFPSDPMRPHTSTFYHLSYLLGEALGIGGSFVPFQIVYAALWWARGFLMFSVLRRLFPEQGLFAFCCGALVIVHAADNALLWVGQLNQFGYLFWMLLAFYLFVLAVQSPVAQRTRWWLAGAAAAQHMSLWSYESQLLLILAAPLALLALGWNRVRPKLRVVAAWYVMPAFYVLVTAIGYATRLAGTYQAGVMRTDWSSEAIASDLWFNLKVSLRFWRWAQHLSWQLPGEWLTVAGVLGAAIYLAGASGAAVLGDRSENASYLSPRTWVAVLLAGIAALLLSFPAYLMLADAGSLWRTQFLSSIGAALVWSSLAGLAASFVPRSWPRGWAFVAMGTLVCWYGTSSALRAGALHDQIWTRQRQAMEAILTLAPRLPERTVIVAVDVPKEDDPFGHNMWFSFALRLAYPGSRVSGVYFYEDGTPGTGNHLSLEGGDWVWDGSIESPGFERRGVENTVVIGFASVKHARVLDKLPEVLSPTEEARHRYSPDALILEGPLSTRAARRYLPCPQWWWTLSPQR